MEMDTVYRAVSGKGSAYSEHSVAASGNEDRQNISDTDGRAAAYRSELGLIYQWKYTSIIRMTFLR